MKETNFLQEGFRKPELEKPDPYYYVCGGRYTYEELDKMTWRSLGLEGMEVCRQSCTSTIQIK